MNRYIMIRRLRGPIFLLLVGVLALLSKMNILGWGKSWPFFLILAGVLTLAERSAMGGEGGYWSTQSSGSYPGSHSGAQSASAPCAYPAQKQHDSGAANQWQASTQSPVESGTAIIPAPLHELEKYSGGDQS